MWAGGRQPAETRLLLLTALAATVLSGCSAPEAATGAGLPRPARQLGAQAAPTKGLDPAEPSGWGPTRGELARARELVQAMSVDRRAAQVLMPAFWGYAANRATPAEVLQNRDMHGVDTAAAAVAARRYGGLFVKPHVISDADQVRRLVTGLHAHGDTPDALPLLVSVDQEGGLVQRIKAGVTPVPAAIAVGATGDLELARRIAHNNAEELRALGFTMVFAPVADVDTAGNTVIGSRSYATDYATAAGMVAASVTGFLEAGVVPVVKHFPGHGSVTGDSHHEMPVQRKSVAELERTDLVPFRAAIAAGVPAVMTAHIAVPAVEPGVPGSLSRGVVQGLLRERLGFQGVAVTDSQGMGPVNGPYGSAEGAVRSLLAGNDLVLNSPDPVRAGTAIVRAVRTGRLPSVRLVDAATRVVALRLFQQRIGSHRPDTSVLRSPGHLADAARAGGG